MAAIEAIRRIHSSQPGRTEVPGPPTRVRGGRMPNLERPRPAGPVLTVAAVIGVGAVLALAVSRLVTGPGPHPSRPAASAGPRPTTGATRTTAVVARSRPHHAGGSPHRGSTTTTSAPVGPLTPTSADSGGADYVLAGGPTLRVQVSTGPSACWLEVGAGPAGPFQFVRTVAAGSTQLFTGTGQLWLRLGAPGGVTVTADGRRLLFTADPARPFNLTVKRSTTS